MAAEQSNKHWRRYVIESSSEDEDEGEDEASLSSGSLASTSSQAAKQAQGNPSAKTIVPRSAVAEDAAVSSGVASTNEIARENPSPDQKLQAQMSQVRRWGEYDLEDSDSSDSDVLGSLGQRLKSSLRLTSPPSPSNHSRTSNENEEPRSRSRESHSLHSRKIDHQQKRIDAADEVVELLDDDDVDEVEILGDSNARQHGATSPRRKRPVHRPGGRLMDDDDESEEEAEYDDGASVSFESGSSSSSSGSVVWEEINRKEPPQRRRGTQDRSRVHREAEHAGEGEDEEEGQWNDDFLGMIPPESAWWYDQDKRHFYLEESDEESFTSAANNQPQQQQRWPRLSVPMPLFRTLYTHQKSGVEWMAGLHVAGIGGILGDDMGMGAYRETVE
jgi:SNF2 family DNA or RNA helicase